MKTVQAMDIMDKFVVFKNIHAKSDKTKYKCVMDRDLFVFIGVGNTQAEAVKACKTQINKWNKGVI